jgi:membrane AbrB-like protein
MPIKMFVTLIIGTLGGVGGFFIHLPIPWLLGSMLAVSVCQLGGMTLARPNKKLERLMRVLIGVALGASVASNIADSSSLLFIVILIAIVFVTLITAFGTQYFLRVNDFRVLDSFMSSLPGGLSFLMALSGDLGKRFPKIALIHTVRVVTLIFAFSLLALFLHADGVNVTFKESFVFDITHFSWSILLLVIVSGLLAEKSKVAGSHVLFSLVIATVAYQLGWITDDMPELVKTLAMIVFGSLLGYELSKAADRSYFSIIFYSIVFTIAVMLAALVIALGSAEYFDQHYLLFLLALAPGGIAEISLITLALGFDAGFVASVHACRFGFIMLVGPVGLNLATRKENKIHKEHKDNNVV